MLEIELAFLLKSSAIMTLQQTRLEVRGDRTRLFMITLDWTLAVAVVVFLMTVWFLNRLLFSPLSAIMDERKERGEGKRNACKSPQT